MENFSVAPELRGVCNLGILWIDGVRIRESPSDLKRKIHELTDAVASQYRSHAPGEIAGVKAIRRIFHKAGMDPTRYRPSSESLLRRVVKGKGLYFINSAVDVVNYFSLKTLLPMGLYNAALIQPPVELRIGKEGESYRGIGRDVLHLAHFPVLADSEGPFGSPISDSVRTQVTEDATRLLWVTLAPPDAKIGLEEFSEMMIRFNEGTVQATATL